MVYYTPSKSIILFGGADEKKVYGDTWNFHNGEWKKVSEEGPSPRTFPCMIMADNYILLFGGNAVLFGSEKNPVHYLDDTWKYQYGKWEKINVRVHPDARAEAAMSYDPVNKEVVLFGGRMTNKFAGDTWKFDGDKWTQIKQGGPTPRSGAAMTYDPQMKQVVLFGGNPVIAKDKEYNGPMWSWDGNDWHRMDTNVPLIFNTCMAYNTKENYMLRFGGWTGKERINETAIYKDSTWKKLNLEDAPAARNHSIMIYDPGKNAFFLFGGHDGENVFGDMWSFKNGKWMLIYSEGPLKRLENGH